MIESQMKKPPFDETSTDERFVEALGRWAETAANLSWVEQWVEGAIFPCEMVFFLARCEQLDIDVVIESGRQDGYSTMILGEFIKGREKQVYSIDYEADAERARRCRERLKAYSSVIPVKGDANILLGQLVNQVAPRKVAMLVDGPKGFWAIALMFACSGNTAVKLLALHNLNRGEAPGKLLGGLANSPLYYEDVVRQSPASWLRLRELERLHCERLGARRSLEYSSLGVMEVADRNRKNIVRKTSWHFRLHQPPLVRMAWKLGLFWPTNRLFDLSNRLFNK